MINLKEIQPKIEMAHEKKFVGHEMRMSLASNKTGFLWQGFMPRRIEIKNTVGYELYSIEQYPSGYFDQFNPTLEFEKWAAVAVENFTDVPENMKTLISAPGLYAIFIYKGSSADPSETFNYIFNTWLPASEYVVDQRPHFAVMGAKYKNNHPDSEEELWIPLRRK